MIERTEYLEKLKRFKDKDLIKVVTGIRRCGKSTLFELFIKYLKEIGIKDSQIIKINLLKTKTNLKRNLLYQKVLVLVQFSNLKRKICRKTLEWMILNLVKILNMRMN